MKNFFVETQGRSVVKAMTFRGVILISDSIIIYLITHRLDITLDVMIASNVASTVIFILHERVWNDVRWGKKTQKVRD